MRPDTRGSRPRAISRTQAAFWSSVALYQIGVPLFGPTVPTMLLQCVPPQRRGFVMGCAATTSHPYAFASRTRPAAATRIATCYWRAIATTHDRRHHHIQPSP